MRPAVAKRDPVPEMQNDAWDLPLRQLPRAGAQQADVSEGEAMTRPERIAKGMWWDRAWTLTKGCTPAGVGCKNCWSAAQSHMRSQQAKPPPCYVGVTDKHGKWNGVVEPLYDNLEVPLRVRKPITWAVWNDLFHEDVPETFINAVFATMARAPNHTFQLLTKRPQRAADLLGQWQGDGVVLPNAWIGASASTRADLERVAAPLSRTPAVLRFYSFEPLLSDLGHIVLDGISWVIVGAESGSNRRECRDEWIEGIALQCAGAGVPCFVKQHHINGRVVKSPAGFPQELPR
jgi:protein gp37